MREWRLTRRQMVWFGLVQGTMTTWVLRWATSVGGRLIKELENNVWLEQISFFLKNRVNYSNYVCMHASHSVEWIHRLKMGCLKFQFKRQIPVSNLKSDGQKWVSSPCITQFNCLLLLELDIRSPTRKEAVTILWGDLKTWEFLGRGFRLRLWQKETTLLHKARIVNWTSSQYTFLLQVKPFYT